MQAPQYRLALSPLIDAETTLIRDTGAVQLSTMVMPPTHRAVWDGNEEEVVRLVAEDGRRLNAPIQIDPWRGCSPLMLASFIFIRQDEMVTRLLEQRDHYGRTPAFYACQSHSPSALSLLLDHGASFDATDGLYHSSC